MIEAYVLIQTEPGPVAARVAERLRGTPGVITADDVSGPYDVIAQVSADDLNSLGKLVLETIQSLEGVTRTLTCPVVHL